MEYLPSLVSLSILSKLSFYVGLFVEMLSLVASSSIKIARYLKITLNFLILPWAPKIPLDFSSLHVVLAEESRTSWEKTLNFISRFILKIWVHVFVHICVCAHLGHPRNAVSLPLRQGITY